MNTYPLILLLERLPMDKVFSMILILLIYGIGAHFFMKWFWPIIKCQDPPGYKHV